MDKAGGSLIDRMAWRRELRRWQRLSREVPMMRLDRLRRTRRAARALRAELDRAILAANARLALPLIGGSGFQVPKGSDWAWRPDLWRGPLSVQGVAAAPAKAVLSPEVSLFHDCARSELTLRQVRNIRAEDHAPFGLRMDVFAFDGSFLSLAVDLPPEAVEGLRRRHLIRLAPILDLERPLEIFARLNIKHGPNTEQLVRELPLHETDRAVEFDLAYSNVNEKRVERMWLDLIFEGPEMNQVLLRDLTVSRSLRAEL